MKAVLIGALAATAFSADTIIVNGNYKVASTAGNACCFPTAAGVTIANGATDATKKQITFTLQNDNTGTCTTALGGGVSVNKEAAVATSNGASTVTVPVTVAGTDKDAVLTIPTAANADFVLNLGAVATGCTATLQKVADPLPPVYTGVYEVKAKNGAAPATCCVPAGDVIIRQPGAATTTVSAEWTFAAVGTNCPTGSALAGTSKSVSGSPNSVTGSVPLSDGTNTWGITFAPNINAKSVLSLGVSPNPTDCSISLEQRTLPTVSPVNVYEVTDPEGTDAKCCYPAGDVTVTADGTNKYKVAWTFGSEAGCGDLKNVAISASGTPDIATKDITIQQTVNGETREFVLDYPTLNTDKFKLDLSDIDPSCAVTIEKKSGYLVGLGSLVALSLSYIMF